MTDSHIRLLRAVARVRERESDDYQSSADRSAQTQADLSDRATRARDQVNAANARRRLAIGDERNS
jgi:hypothetical protein